MASTTLDLIEGEALASACAMVGIMKRASLVFVDAREQKKLAPSRLPRSRISQRVCEMDDFPVPATPTSQYTLQPLSSKAHASRFARMFTRVPAKQPWGSPYDERRVLYDVASWRSLSMTPMVV